MPAILLKSAGDQRVLLSGGTVATGGDCCCCPDATLNSVSIQGTLSGSLVGGSECTVPDTDYAISASSELAECTPCVTGCATSDVSIVFTCPSECVTPDDPNPTISFAVVLNWSGIPGEHWFLQIDITYNDTHFCGLTHDTLGGEGIFLIDIGVDPTGTHTLSFNDPNRSSVHYDVIVDVMA